MTPTSSCPTCGCLCVLFSTCSDTVSNTMGLSGFERIVRAVSPLWVALLCIGMSLTHAARCSLSCLWRGAVHRSRPPAQQDTAAAAHRRRRGEHGARGHGVRVRSAACRRDGAATGALVVLGLCACCGPLPPPCVDVCVRVQCDAITRGAPITRDVFVRLCVGEAAVRVACRACRAASHRGIVVLRCDVADILPAALRSSVVGAISLRRRRGSRIIA